MQAQRAKKAAAPAEPSLADTFNETLHAAAQHARKAAGQASAAAQAAAAEAMASAEHRHSQRGTRRRGGGIGVMLALLAAGWVFFSSNHGVMVNGDHAALTYSGNRGVAVVTGDNDAITLRGDCDTLLVLGDHDHITALGTVKHIIAPGDHNTIRWTQGPGGQPPSIVDNGDGNQISPASASPQ